jgi:ribosomal protein S18 acetylase RimI-like enzyme/predicted nucleic acid-binding protein
VNSENVETVIPPTGSQPSVESLADGAQFDAVLRLHRSSKATLGPMPTEGFKDRIAAGTLTVATLDEKVVGYVLYDLPRDRVKVVHLCVSKAARRRGVARALVNDLRARHAQRRGIQAHCRRDFVEASATWEALGFRPERDRPGRSLSGHLITIWWLDFGHDDLFSLSPGLRDLAALDQSVYEDIVTGRAGGSESRRLLDDWLGEYVEFCVTDEVHRESNRCEDPAMRQQLLMPISGWRHVARGVKPSDNVVARVGGLAASAGLGDHRHVALALEGGAAYFVTRDDDLLAGADGIYDEYKIRILRPEWLIRELDRIRRHDSYEPVALHATRYREVHLTDARKDEFIRVLLNSANGERKTQLDARVRESLAAADTDTIQVILDANDRLVAGTAFRVIGDQIAIRLARVRGADKASRAIGRQILGQIRTEAARRRIVSVVLEDRHPSPALMAGLEAEGFRESPNSWRCTLNFGLDTAVISDPWSASRRELDNWPAKVVGSGIATFLVPIEATFAEQLFDSAMAAETLFGRETRLGLSREHVYYRSPRTARFLRGPARVLWYVKASRTRGWAGGIRATSYLEEVVIGRPRTLFSRYEHLGAWELNQVLSVAHNGEVMALRVTNSEPFERYMAVDELRSAYQQYGVGLQLQGPAKVPEHMFCLIYAQCSQYGQS